MQPSKASPLPRQSKSWRDVLPIHPAAERLPLMSQGELQELADDIRKRGLQIPCFLVEDRYGEVQLFDGRNRLDALELIGKEIRLDSSIIFERFPADSINVDELVISLNIRRRHLTIEDQDRLIVEVLKADPTKSNRRVAKLTGTSHPHVAKVRERGKGWRRGNGYHVSRHQRPQAARGSRLWTLSLAILRLATRGEARRRHS